MTTIAPTTPLPDIPVLLTFGADSIDDIEVTDADIVSDTCERISIGGAGPLHGRYLRVEADDLADVGQALVRLGCRLIDAVMDARNEKLDAEQHRCICGTQLEPDMEHCGAAFCRRQAEQEAAYESLGLI